MNNKHHHDSCEEGLGENHNDNDDLQHEDTIATLQFPIRKQLDMPIWKIFHPQLLPHSRGKSTEDPDEFLFDFDILCRIYDYTSSDKKLKLFPTTLKDNSLRWFMSLGGDIVTTWDQMKQVILVKYQVLQNKG